ncbi:protein FAR1-RELATED SEQUENCE 2-like [Silene latifolia]|uniref:protein FAR1-RELATED SEQUENCE 2-like n=1 Tax=Silene latifolia TaxID=37657 RepID=UPI003D77E12B
MINSDEQTLTLPDNIADNQTSMNSGIEINNTNATTLSTPTVASETGENTIHNLGLRYTPGGSEEWSRMVENDFKPALGLMLVKLEEAIEFYNLYAVACSFIPRKYTQTRFRDGLIDKKSMGLSESHDGFYFAYEVDEDNCLARIFWADAQARMNYSMFGDTITFDPTYGANKYHMAFTPFTGVDNRKKSVTFAAALVDHENDGSFIWVFKKFLDCMGNQEPQCILTDQDPSIKLGVRSDTDLEPTEFEEKWSHVISDFELNDNTWLTYMYGKRHKWTPAYFNDLPLGCLLKTTQRSESQNNYCKRFESIDGTVVEFWLRFQSAMEQQRYNQRFLDAASDSTLPEVSSKTMIEKHASKIYTHTVFYEFQEQVQAAPCSCAIRGFSEQGNMDIIGVEDAYKQRRIFQIISGKGLHSIPEQYIESRWTKKSYRKPLYGLDGKLLQDYDPTDLRKLELSRVWSEFYATISVLNSMPQNQIKELSLMLLQFREKINPTKESLTKEQELEMLLGCSAKSNITILSPKIAKNKGSGKRMKSNKDNAIEKL